MALKSDLSICLMWEADPPSFNMPQQSCCFRMLGEVWYLELWLEPVVICRVDLCRRGGQKTLDEVISADCYVITQNLILRDTERRTVRHSGDKIFHCFIPKRNLRSTERFRNWMIFCDLRCAKPLSIQIINETIRLSTNPEVRLDKNIQTSAIIPPEFQRLSDDFSRLLKEEVIPDATLTCGDRTWRVHRSVLTVRSEVFAAMFRSGMTESETGLIRVEDLEPPVLNSLLRYIYCGEVPDISGENVSGLYEAADRYALHGLRKACSDWMNENLSDEKCISYLIVADAHNDAELKNDVTSFIIDHSELFESATWEDFIKKCPTLGVEVLQRFALSVKK